MEVSFKCGDVTFDFVEDYTMKKVVATTQRVHTKIMRLICQMLNVRTEEKAEETIKIRLEQRKIEERNQRILMAEYENKNILLSRLEQYNFEGFIHTTEFGNFQKIIECGDLKSRVELESTHTTFIDRAMPEIIEKTSTGVKEYCRFYYYYMTPTNFKAAYSRPVTMVFDKNIIFSNKKIIFSEGNAASEYSVKTNYAKKALDFDWDSIFEREYYSQSKKYSLDKNGDDTNSRHEITRLRNAEFLIESPVSIINIKKIYFKNWVDMIAAKQFCSDDIIAKFEYDRSRFAND